MASYPCISQIRAQMLRCQSLDAASAAAAGEPALPMRIRLHRCHIDSSAAIRNRQTATAGGLKINRKIIKAAVSLERAVSSSTEPSLFDPEYRAKLAEEYGFTQIAEPLPSNVTINDIRATIPPEAYQMHEWKAWRSFAISMGIYVAGLCITAVAAWYVLPLGWLCSTIGLAGLFVVGHDCGHKTFCSNKLVEDIVGTVSLLPLIYPYEPWRFKHNHHHAKTNMLHEDTAWHPVMKDDHDDRPAYARIAHQLLWSPFRLWGTIWHWRVRHFDPAAFRPQQQNRVKLSIALVLAFAAITWPSLVCLAGISGWVNLWLLPWLGFHVLMSGLTSVHHSAPHIHFKDATTWRNAEAQLVGTVNCRFPKVLEFVCHYIMVHIPHHISPMIPSYNLPLANDALRKRWGKHFNETYPNWRLLKVAMTQCHLYDEEKGYVPFDEGKEKSIIIEAVRRWMPNFA